MEHEVEAVADQAQPDPQALAVLPPPERAAVALQSSATERRLRDLIEHTVGITNVVDKNGRDEAHRAGMMLKNARITIDKTGKAAREDATAFQRAVVAEVERLAAITADEEARLFKLRDDFDAKLAAEKAEKERIEAERKAAIRAKIDAILRLPAEYAGMSALDLTRLLGQLANRDIDAEGFEEFAGEARAAVDTAAAAIIAMRNTAAEREEAARQAAVQREIEQRQAEEARQEVLRLKAEAAERDRVATEKARADAAAQAALEQQLADMRAQMEAMQAAAQPAPEPDPPVWTLVPSIDEALVVSPEAIAEAYRHDHAVLNALPKPSPSEQEIVDVLATHYEESRETVVGWLLNMDELMLKVAV